MDFPLNSSVVLAVIVGLWLVWVVPFFHHRSAPSAVPVSLPTSTAGGHRPQGSTMDRTAHVPAAQTPPGRTGALSASSPSAGFPSDGTPGQPALKLRWGRVGVALAGALALPVAVVTLVLAVVSVVSFWWPVAAVLVAGGAVAALRALAVRDRRARVNAAFADAMSSRPLRPEELRQGASDQAPRTEDDSTAAARVRDVPVFDAQSSGPAVEPAPRQTAADLLAAARAVAAAGTPAGQDGATVDGAGAGTAAPQAAPVGTSPWEPVQVPLPTYVEAERARRSAPAPLELPAEPKPTVRTPIKNSEAAKAAPAESAAPAASSAMATGGRINLDDVLQRRRA